MEINNVVYGNPTIEHKKILDSKCLVSDLFPKLKSEKFPANDSELTKDELNDALDNVSAIKEPENALFLKKYKAYDRNLPQVIISAFKQRNIDVEKMVEEIISDINSLVMKLKYFYQRPRPFQLAEHYKLALFPYKSYLENSPSYPSGQGVRAYIILNVIGNKYPNLYPFCKEMIDDVMYSGLYLGLHYPSDNDFAVTVGKEILKHKEFAKKYGI